MFLYQNDKESLSMRARHNLSFLAKFVFSRYNAKAFFIVTFPVCFNQNSFIHLLCFFDITGLLLPLFFFNLFGQAEHLIELADADTNDELTYQEILDRLDLFAGSIESHKGVFHHEDELWWSRRIPENRTIGCIEEKISVIGQYR